MLYDENPKYLSEVLAKLCGEEEIGNAVGVSFLQQQRKGIAVPDGIITQRPFTIYIETKNYDWFYDEQLERHLDELAKEACGIKILLALGNFDTTRDNKFDRIINICDDKYTNKILFRAVSFEALIHALTIIGLPKNLADAIEEFREFLNEENLLPNWKYLLDVVNCATTTKEIDAQKAYICPMSGGAYSHNRAKFFGIYSKKSVNKIAAIEAVVDVYQEVGQGNELKAKLKWKNIDDKNKDLEDRALGIINNLKKKEDSQIFLLGKLYDTEFKKDTPGGMFSSKRYFDIAHLKSTTADDLAKKLKGLTWSKF